MSDFYRYFKENMEGLGLPAPDTLFGNLTTAVGTASVILGAIDKFGKSVTIAEVIGAGTRLEGLSVIGSLSASYYAGAVVGSLAVALGRTLSGGTSIVDVISTASKYNLNRPWMVADLYKRPGIYKPETPFRDQYRYQVGFA